AARQNVTGAVERFAGASGLTPDDARRLREAAQDDPLRRQADDADVARAAAVVAAGTRTAGTGGAGTDASAAGTDAGATDAAEERPGVHAIALAHVARLEEEADRLAEREVAANAALVAARDRLEAERALAEGVERRARLRAEQERLDRAEDEVAQDRRRVDAAARAAVVAPAAQGLARADQALHAAHERLALARTGLPPDLADADATTLEALRADVATAAVRAARLVPVGASLPVRERELADARKDLAHATEERERVLAELADRPTLRDALRTRVAALAEAAGDLGVLQERLLRARAVEVAATQAAALADDVEAAEEERAGAAAAARAAVEHEARVRSARIAGLAGELAAGLDAGEPCPVCGGTEHPEPAPLAPDHPAAEDVERAERARAEAERSLHDASARVQVLAERLASGRRDAEGLTPVEAAARVVEVDAS